MNVSSARAAGLNHNALRLQLETLFLVPGVDVAMVTVLYDEKFDESEALARIFGVRTQALSGSTKYVGELRARVQRLKSFD